MKNVPKTIYLNVGFDDDYEGDFNGLAEVTWSRERIDDADIEYHLNEQQETPLILEDKRGFKNETELTPEQLKFIEEQRAQGHLGCTLTIDNQEMYVSFYNVKTMENKILKKVQIEGIPQTLKEVLKLLNGKVKDLETLYGLSNSLVAILEPFENNKAIGHSAFPNNEYSSGFNTLRVQPTLIGEFYDVVKNLDREIEFIKNNIEKISKIVG